MSTRELPSAPLGAVVRASAQTSETTRLARLLWLRSLFGDASPNRHLETLVSRMTEFFLPRGKELFVAGTSSDSIYFIVKGVVRHGETGYTRFQTGDVLGFVDGMSERPHKYTAHVEADAVILRLKMDDWLEYLEEHFLEARRMITSTASRTDGFADIQPDEESGHVGLPRDLGPLPAAEDSKGHLVRRLLAVKSCLLFRRAGIQSIAQLVRRGDEFKLAPGESLHPDLTNPGLYLLLSGQVTCRVGSFDAPSTFTTDRVGELLGAVAALRQLPPVFEIAAREESILLYFDPEDYFDVMEDHFDVTRSTLAYLALRIEVQNRRRGAEKRA